MGVDWVRCWVQRGPTHPGLEAVHELCALMVPWSVPLNGMGLWWYVQIIPNMGKHMRHVQRCLANVECTGCEQRGFTEKEAASLPLLS